MENGVSEAITVIITAAVGAVIRYFEKRRLKRAYQAGQYFKK